MKISKSITLILLSAFLITLTISSCNKDIEGCMDSEAANFNPDANVDSGVCEFARDKFLGTFIGDLTCQAPLPNSDGFQITISEGLTDNSEVEISFENTDTPIPVLIGTVTGNSITIPDTEASVALNPDFPEIKSTIVFSGEAQIDEIGVNLTGFITAFVAILGGSATCDIAAVKQ